MLALAFGIQLLGLVLRDHTLFRKRGKGSDNFFYSSLLCHSVQWGTNHSTVFCHMSAVITTSIGNYKCETTRNNCETTSSLCKIIISQ